MNVFDLMATLSLDRSAYNRGLNDAEREARGFGGRLVGTLGGAAKAAGAALAAAGAGIATIAKQALSEYANYEQLVGGVDTLFGESADLIIANAERAFATVGLSANQYMETVTSFSASLIQSTAGDTAKAADYADMALRDMADNANKMGTNMASIQNAYQGFAKQNYTMLDNLKLGYGGTKTEMLRLVEDAERINSEFHAIRDKNGDIALSYADVVRAIHIVQQEMGITGTTAAEAAGTITGSTAAVRAAWQNLLTGLGDETADLDKLVDNFTDTLLTNIGNMAPRIEKILRGIGRASQKLIPKVLKEALKIVNKMLPDFVDSAKSLVADIGQVIFDEAPELIAGAVSIIADLAGKLGTAMPTLIPAITQGINSILMAIVSNAPVLAQAAITLMQGLAEGLINAIPYMELPKIIDGIVNFLTNNLGDIIDAGIKLFTALIQNISAIVSAISSKLPDLIAGILDPETGLLAKDNLGKIIDAGVTLFVALVSNIADIITGLVKALPDIIDGILDPETGLLSEENLGKMLDAGVQLFTAIVSNVPRILEALASGLDMILEGIIDRLFGEGAYDKVTEASKNFWDRVFGTTNKYSPATNETWGKYRSFIETGGWSGSYGTGQSADAGKPFAQLEQDAGKPFAQLEQGAGKAKGAIEELETVFIRTREVVDEWKPVEDGKSLAQGLFEGIKGEFDDSYAQFEDGIVQLKEITEDVLGIHSPSTVFAEIGENMAMGLGVGFNQRMTTIREGIISTVMSLVTAVRNALGIHSPSTVWAEIGASMAQGLANGFKRTMAAEAAGINNSIPNGSTNGGTGASGGSGTHITQNVYAYQMTPNQAFTAAQEAADTAQFLTAY